MDAFSRKLLARLMAIAVTASLLTVLVMTGIAGGQPLTCPLDEDFSGSWLPSGWTQEEAGEWRQSFTSDAGGTSPEALLYFSWIYGDYAYLDSKPVDTTGAPSLTLEFKSFIIDYRGADNYTCRVYTRADEGDSWTDVTPWSNPIYGDVGPGTYQVDISSDIGTATQVRFEFAGNYYEFDYWYVDDVKICGDIPPPPGPYGMVCETSLIAYTGSGTNTTHNFAVWPGATVGYVLVEYRGDFGYEEEFIDVYIEGDYIGRGYNTSADCNERWAETAWPLTAGQLSGWAADGTISVTVANSWEVNDFCDYNQHRVTLCYSIPPVGGEAYPVSKASLLAPWIAVAVLLIGGISWYVLRRRKAQS